MNENRDRVHSEGEYSQEYEKFLLELLKAEENYSGKSVTGDRILHRTGDRILHSLQNCLASHNPFNLLYKL